MDTITPFPAGSFMGLLEPADQLEVVREGHRMTLPAGATLLFEGDLSDRVVVVVSGAVRVFATASNGREVLVTVAGPGEIMGEMSAVDGQAHSASVNTLDEADVVLVPAASFRAVMQGNARVAFAVAIRLTRELRQIQTETLPVAIARARNQHETGTRQDAQGSERRAGDTIARRTSETASNLRRATLRPPRSVPPTQRVP